MERLTQRYGDNGVELVNDTIDAPGVAETIAMHRLADYEDTGLTPAEVAELKERQRWIPVSKRLPDCDPSDESSSKDLLIAIKYKTDKVWEHPTICCGYLLDGEWWSYTEHSCHPVDDTVVAWMPLPKPPREEHDGI